MTVHHNHSDSAPTDEFPSLSAKMSKRLVKYGLCRIQASGLKAMYEQQCQSNKERPVIHVVHHDEIRIGELLGSGAFGNIYAVKVLQKTTNGETLQEQKHEHEEPKHEHDHDHSNGHCLQCEHGHSHNHEKEQAPAPKPTQLVLKVLQAKWLENPNVFATSACDLVQEGMLLACLQHHPNILGLYGWSNEDCMEAFLKGTHDAFYLLLERLDGTLAEKLHEWKELYATSINRSLLMQKRQCKGWCHRHLVAMEMASALEYMHAHCIMHRDLKPENIGLKHGHVKIFDLDVARIVPTTKMVAAINEDTQGQSDVVTKTNADDDKRNKDDPNVDLFQLTRCIGSERYQSPECGLGKPYNLKSDVYGFGLLLWEIWTLQKPYNNVPLHLHHAVVFTQGQRPKVPKLKKNNRGEHEGWTQELIQLMESCWSPTIASRPTMKQARNQLQQALLAPSSSEATDTKTTPKAAPKEESNASTASSNSSTTTTPTASKCTPSSSKKRSFFRSLFGRRTTGPECLPLCSH